jgi:hypothetical protein
MSCKLKTEQLKDTLKTITEHLKSCLNKTSFSENEAQDLKESIEQIRSTWGDFVNETSELLEFLEKISDEKAKGILKNLLFTLKGSEIKYKLDKIEKFGKGILHNESLVKAIDRNRFKLIENTRLEKFDEVIYILERIFFGSQEQPPGELLKLLSNPLIPNEIKKSAVYIFLSATFKQKPKEGT